MHNERPFLGWALALSLALHAALISLGLQEARQRSARLPPTELTVRLPAAPEPLPVPRLALPEPQPNAIAAPSPTAARPRAAVRSSTPALQLTDAPQRRAGDAIPRLDGEAALRAAEQLARDLPYPAEAIDRGLQGEALVLIFLDPVGNAIAARLESSSGHAILDDAAVRAARQLRSLPASAPREALLPVRFRLR